MKKNIRNTILVGVGVVLLGAFGGNIVSASEKVDGQIQETFLDYDSDNNLVTTIMLSTPSNRFDGINVTRSFSGQIHRIGPSTKPCTVKSNGRTYKGTLYFQSSVLDKTYWTYTWYYSGYLQ
ncbi:hypothetical protein [Vagococcus silagei]|uniref:Uncharacterized protein n=1 Tax=Vagococcus silagei TaxID=2508885 RepID=A0A4S3B1D2_9ENTE|nr:hypothetical protein [Vagococcus silagei]THB60572.1 hypothetical protein ESZ54_09520 [Vagococcus silagei]